MVAARTPSRSLLLRVGSPQRVGLERDPREVPVVAAVDGGAKLAFGYPGFRQGAGEPLHLLAMGISTGDTGLAAFVEATGPRIS